MIPTDTLIGGSTQPRALTEWPPNQPSTIERLRVSMPTDRVNGWIVTLIIGAIAFVIRYVNLGYPNKLVFDETYPETDEALRTMPTRFAALAQWYELTWGNVVGTRTELHALCRAAGLQVAEETSFSRFSILVAEKGG